MSIPTSDTLGSIIGSARVRKAIYAAYVVAIVVIGAIQVGFAAVSAGQPEWLTVALAVTAYLGVPVGGLAVANASPSVSRDDVLAPLVNLTPTEIEADIQAAASRKGI